MKWWKCLLDGWRRAHALIGFRCDETLPKREKKTRRLPQNRKPAQQATG
jgi:hypothetical protein